MKKAEVHWVGTFWRTNNGNWNVNVYLLYDGQIVQTYLPIGAMPYLAVGAQVVDGYLRGSQATEDLKEFRINDLSAGSLIRLSEMPKSLCSFYGNKYLANELVYRYTKDNRVYYIPQTEIIRSLLTVNTTLANHIVLPEGLSLLISKYELADDKVTVEVAKEFPKKLLMHTNIIHLMSLFLSGSLRRLWSSVYANTIKGNNNKQMLNLVPLKGIKIYFKYASMYNSYFVKEIREIEGFRPPFSSVVFSHPDVKDYIGDPEIEKRKIPKGDKGDRELDNTTEPGADNNRDVAWHDSICVRMKFKGVKAEHSLEKIDSAKKQIKNVNTQESVFKYSLGNFVGNGKGKPIELQNLTALPADVDVYGLEKFLAAVSAMERSGYAKVHKVVVEPLEGDTAFVRIGSRNRSCAIVFVENSVIIEFSRPDEYPISTLIINRYDHASIYDNIKRLIVSAIENNGHWDTGFLDGFHSFNYKFAKHSKADVPYKWGYRLLAKITLF
ncbi:MAG: hypothetical protein AB7F25_06440 [Deferribacterales bacterium]